MNLSVRSYVRKHVPGIADKVLAQVRACINAECERRPDAAIPPGHSKLCGRPDVPQGFEWPVLGGVPCWFIAQANLGEVPDSLKRELCLPRTGLVSFFYHEDGGPPGPGSRVYYFPAKGLQRIEVLPDPRYEGVHDHHLYPRVLTLSPGYCLPREVSQYDFTRAERAVAVDRHDPRVPRIIGCEREGYGGFDYFWEMFHNRFAPATHRLFGLPRYQTPPPGYQLLGCFGQMCDRLNFYAPHVAGGAVEFSGLKVTFQCT